MNRQEAQAAFDKAKAACDEANKVMLEAVRRERENSTRETRTAAMNATQVFEDACFAVENAQDALDNSVGEEAPAPFIIALAKVELTDLRETDRLVKFDGYNLRPEVERAPAATALIWLNEGTADDLEAARRHAFTEGYEVLTFPVTEPDPLGKAKAAALFTFQIDSLVEDNEREATLKAKDIVLAAIEAGPRTDSLTKNISTVSRALYETADSHEEGVDGIRFELTHNGAKAAAALLEDFDGADAVQRVHLVLIAEEADGDFAALAPAISANAPIKRRLAAELRRLGRGPKTSTPKI